MALPGQTSTGSGDAFVRRYDTNGAEVWTRQFGSASDEKGRGISVNSTGVYLAGYTQGALPGQTSAGDRDVFVAKLAGTGTITGTVTHSSTGDPIAGAAVSADTSESATTDADGIYILNNLPTATAPSPPRLLALWHGSSKSSSPMVG